MAQISSRTDLRLALLSVLEHSFPSASRFAPLVKEGAPLRPVEMVEGSIIAPASLGLVMVKDIPHPNAARVFANWFFSQEGQHIYHEAAGTESLRKDVPNFTPAPGRLTPKKVLWMSAEDDIEAAKIQRERVLKNLLLGK